MPLPGQNIPPTTGATPAGNPMGPELSGPPTVSGPVAPPPQEQGPEAQNADPAKVQADAHKLVTRGLELLHSKQTRDKIIQSLKDSTDPVQGVADQAKAIIQRADSMTRTDGIEISPISKITGGKDLVDEIAELAEAAGLGPMDEDDRELSHSVSMQDYIKEEIAAGRIDPAELQAGVAESMGGLDKEGMEAANQQMLKLNKTAMRRKERMGEQPPAPPEAEGVV